MNKILAKSKLILIILTAVLIFVGFLSGIGMVADGTFGSIVGGILYWCTVPLLLALLLISLLTGNEKAVKFLLCVLASYFVMSYVAKVGPILGQFYDNAPTTYTLYLIFAFIFYLSAASAFILIALMVAFKGLGLLKKVVELICLIALCCGAVALVFSIIFAIDQGAGWTSYFEFIAEFAVIPCFLFIAKNFLLGEK